MAKKIYIPEDHYEKAKNALINANLEFAISKEKPDAERKFRKIIVRNVIAEDAVKALEASNVRIYNPKSRKTHKYLLKNQRHYEMFCLTNEYYEKRTDNKKENG